MKGTRILSEDSNDIYPRTLNWRKRKKKGISPFKHLNQNPELQILGGFCQPTQIAKSISWKVFPAHLNLLLKLQIPISWSWRGFHFANSTSEQKEPFKKFTSLLVNKGLRIISFKFVISWRVLPFCEYCETKAGTFSWVWQ